MFAKKFWKQNFHSIIFETNHDPNFMFVIVCMYLVPCSWNTRNEKSKLKIFITVNHIMKSKIGIEFSNIVVEQYHHGPIHVWFQFFIYFQILSLNFVSTNVFSLNHISTSIYQVHQFFHRIASSAFHLIIFLPLRWYISNTKRSISINLISNLLFWYSPESHQSNWTFQISFTTP